MTFISRDKQAIFVHLHKCGGTSVEMALDQCLAWDDILLGSSRYGERMQRMYQERFGLYKHSTAAQIKQVVGDDFWEQCFTFAIVRHPIDRIVSFYEYMKTYYLGGPRGAIVKTMFYLDQMHELPESLTKLPKIYDSYRWPGVTASLQSKSVAEFIHADRCWEAYGTQSQFSQLADEAGETLLVKSVIRLEDLNDNWPHVCEKLGVNVSLPHKNKSKRKYKDWRQYFSLDDINFLAEQYRLDIDRFGYSI